jgi:hypothetical protein
VAKLQQLEQISISKRRAKVVTAAEAKAVTDIVPPRRLAHVEREQHQIKLDLGSLVCCPQ